MLQHISVQQQTETRPASPSLRGIPGELRTRIFELALFHDASDGVISPLPDLRSDECMTLLATAQDPQGTKQPPVSSHWSTQCMPTIPCERFEIDCNNGLLLRKANEDDARRSDQSVGDLQLANERRGYLFITTANATSKHFCTLDCLLQPSLSRVRLLFISSAVSSGKARFFTDNVAQVDRQFREEALGVLYTVNHFTSN